MPAAPRAGRAGRRCPVQQWCCRGWIPVTEFDERFARLRQPVPASAPATAQRALRTAGVRRSASTGDVSRRPEPRQPLLRGPRFAEPHRPHRQADTSPARRILGMPPSQEGDPTPAPGRNQADPAGGYSERLWTLSVDNLPPVDKSRLVDDCTPGDDLGFCELSRHLRGFWAPTRNPQALWKTRLWIRAAGRLREHHRGPLSQAAISTGTGPVPSAGPSERQPDVRTRLATRPWVAGVRPRHQRTGHGPVITSVKHGSPGRRALAAGARPPA